MPSPAACPSAALASRFGCPVEALPAVDHGQLLQLCVARPDLPIHTLALTCGPARTPDVV